MCLVEVGEKKPDGTVAMQPKLVPGCQTPVKDGTVVIADSPKVKAAQKATLEYLLLNHPLDCPTCDQAGECWLQDYSYQVRPRLQPAAGAEEHQAGQGPHRRPDHAVHRSLHHVHPLRAVHARDQRHGRAAGHRPRHARRDRHLPRRAVQQQAGRQRRRPVPRRRPVQQGLSVQAARVVAEDGQERLPQLQHRLQHRRRPERRPRLPPDAAAESAGAGALHVRRGPVRLEVHPREQRLTFPEQRDRRQASSRAAGTTSCRRCARR